LAALFRELQLDMIDSNAGNSTLFVTIFVETVNLAAEGFRQMGRMGLPLFSGTICQKKPR
jgi:hypothetical protein